MTPSGIHGGIAGYDPSTLQGQEDRFQTERDTAATAVAVAQSPIAQPDASPVDRSELEPLGADPRHTVTYGRRALGAPSATVGRQLDVTG